MREAGEGNRNIGTYIGVMMPDGTLRGEGQGVIMTEDGGVATWASRPEAGPARAGEGTLLYRTQSPSLMRLNGMAGAFEYEVDETNKTEGTLYEWK